MVTLPELRALARDYGLPGRSKLKKDDLTRAIAEVPALELIKRLQLVQKTGRRSAIQNDVENPPQEGLLRAQDHADQGGSQCRPTSK